MYTIITNNRLVMEKHDNTGKKLSVEYLENQTGLDVLIKVRDYIHKGYRLETHPMAGSVKPNQNPYKSVMISDDKTDTAEFQEFITVIENCIMKSRDFLSARSLPEWPEDLKADFRFVDLSLIESALFCLR